MLAAFYLALSWQKHQNVALVPVVCLYRSRCSHLRNVATVGICVGIFDVNVKHTALALYERSLQQVAYSRSVDSGRHNDNLDVWAYYLLRLAYQGQSKVGVDATFVKFVKHHHVHTLKRSVVHQHTCQNALGEHLDSCLARHLVFKSYPIAYGLPHGFAYHMSHPFGYLSCGKSARFEHQYLACAA